MSLHGSLTIPFLFAGGLAAQDDRGSLLGCVTDATGAVVPATACPGLLQLHCALSGEPHQLGHNDVNW